MSNKKTFEKITDSQARKASIETLSDRPNKTSHFGEGGLSAQQLKQRFDALPELSRKKINEIIAAFNTVEGAKYIGIDAADQDNLYDFLALFKAAERNGKNIADYIEILHEPIDGGKETSTSIKDIINEVCSELILDRAVLAEVNVRSNENRSDIEALSDTVNEVNSRVDEGFSKQEERIIGIERYLGGDNFIVDDSTAYEKTVPKNACEKAKVLSIGGMTYKKKTDEGNLMPYPYINKDAGFSDDAGELSTIFSSRATLKITDGDEITYPVGNYIYHIEIVSGGGDIESVSLDFVSNGSTLPSITTLANDRIMVTATESFSIARFNVTVTSADDYTQIYIAPMFYNSNNPITWQPRGKAELRHAKVKAIESRGANLFDKSKVSVTPTETGFSFTNTGAAGAPTPIGKFKDLAPDIKVGDRITFYTECVNGSLGNAHGLLHIQGSATSLYGGNFMTITQADIDSTVYAYGDLNKVCEYKNMIFTKYANTPYTPYVGTIDTFTIPEEVQAREGYGDGVSEDDYNYIERTDGGRWLLHKRSGCVDMGTLDWLRGSIANDGVSYTMHCTVPGMKPSSAVMLPDFSQRFDCLYWEDLNGGEMMTTWDSIIVLAVKGYGSGTDFKAAMAGVMLYYALAEPIVTDITDIMPKENLIKVLGGCRIVAENEQSDPVPFSIKYLVTYQREDA